MDIELVVLSVPAFLGMSLIVLRVWKYFDLPLPLNASLFQVEGLFLLPVAGILLGAILLVILQEPLLFLGVIAVSLVLLGVAYPIAFYFEDIRETVIHRLDSRREENALVRQMHWFAGSIVSPWNGLMLCQNSATFS
jgi:hypothetical protein